MQPYYKINNVELNGITNAVNLSDNVEYLLVPTSVSISVSRLVITTLKVLKSTSLRCEHLQRS